MLMDLADFDDHETVSFISDRKSELQAIIAIHDTTLGPAHGGTRALSYDTELDATVDVLRLSRGMTFKNALAGLPLGGGKSVIRLPAGQEPTREQLHAFGRAIEAMGGRYLPAEDVGMGPKEVALVAEMSSHVLGIGGSDGVNADPSPFTALGVFVSIQEMLRRSFGTGSLDHRTIAIQGLGNVGANLARLVSQNGGGLVVADIDPSRTRWAQDELGAKIVATADIHAFEADVFAPCALGSVLDADTIPRLGAGIVCGGANNQLADDLAGRMLAEAGVDYAPDFVVNAGGVMWTSAPLTGLDRRTVETKVRNISQTLARILDGMLPGETPQDAAIRAARSLIARE